MDLLARITFDPGQKPLPKIDWPAGLAPSNISSPRSPGMLPQANALVVTWTAAEARALADVLSPGIQSTDWAYYKTNYAAYESQLTERSPARGEGRLGSWATCTIGVTKVILFKSELHPATDGPSLPTAQLIAQVAKECGCGYVVTTGTAGGAGDGTRLGDVNIADAVHADFTTRLKGQTWDNQSWNTAVLNPTQQGFLERVPGMVPDPVGYPVGSGAMDGSEAPALWYGHVVSTDFFAFDTDTDTYHLRAYDPEIRAVEMDDAAVSIGAARVSVPVASVRNASDPVMPNGSAASDKQAESIYQKYGYYTTVNSAVATWAMLAGLPGDTLE